MKNPVEYWVEKTNHSGEHSHSKERTTTFRQWKPSHKQPGHWQETILGSNQHPIQEIMWTTATGCTPGSDWAFTQEDNERPLQALPYWVQQHTIPQVWSASLLLGEQELFLGLSLQLNIVSTCMLVARRTMKNTNSVVHMTHYQNNMQSQLV